MRKHKTKYKKHVRLEWSNNALCGSQTSAPKLLIEQWRELPPIEHCSICELALNMSGDPASIDVAEPPIQTKGEPRQADGGDAT